MFTGDRSIYEREEIFLVVCSYCEKILNRNEIQETMSRNETKRCFALRVSHAICPDCLLKNFPNEYVAIQQNSKVRIKNAFSKGYTFLNEKVSDKS